MDQLKKLELQKDWWRFMIMGSVLFSIFEMLIRRNVDTERLPFQYYLMAGTASFAVEVALYYFIRNWPGRWKIFVIWLFVFIWLAICLT